MDKSMFKMTSEELQQWLAIRKKGYAIENKKGKGSYNRKVKHKNRQFQGDLGLPKKSPGRPQNCTINRVLFCATFS